MSGDGDPVSKRHSSHSSTIPIAAAIPIAAKMYIYMDIIIIELIFVPGLKRYPIYADFRINNAGNNGR